MWIVNRSRVTWGPGSEINFKETHEKCFGVIETFYILIEGWLTEEYIFKLMGTIICVSSIISFNSVSNLPAQAKELTLILTKNAALPFTVSPSFICFVTSYNQNGAFFV